MAVYVRTGEGKKEARPVEVCATLLFLFQHETTTPLLLTGGVIVYRSVGVSREGIYNTTVQSRSTV